MGLNKYIFIALLCPAFLFNYGVQSSEQGNKQQNPEELHPVEIECCQELGIDIKQRSPISIQQDIKVVTCVYKKVGIMTDDGKFSLQATKVVLKQMYPNQEQLDRVLAVVMDCEREINNGTRPNDKTEAMIQKCLFEAAVAAQKGDKATETTS